MANRKRAIGSPAKRAAAAKKAAAEVLAAQRRDIADARDLCRTLVVELSLASAESEAIEEAVALLPDIDKKRQTALLRAISLDGRAATLRELANATRILIELERGAFDLSADDDSDAAQTQPSAIDAIAARIARLAAADEAPAEP